MINKKNLNNKKQQYNKSVETKEGNFYLALALIIGSISVFMLGLVLRLMAATSGGFILNIIGIASLIIAGILMIIGISIIVLSSRKKIQDKEESKLSDIDETLLGYSIDPNDIHYKQ